MLERYGHGGDVWTAAESFGHAKEQFIDFSSNMNPFGPPAAVKELLQTCWQDITRYPDPAVRALRQQIAEVYRIPIESILVGNGAAELIELAVRLVHPGITGLVRPSFSEYEEAVRKTDGQIYDIPVSADNGFRLQLRDVEEAMKHVDLMFLGQPNNPTGQLISKEILKLIVASGKPLIVDEAFIDFVPDEEYVSLIRHAAVTKDLFVIRSMTKFYAIPGIRLGFMVAEPSVISQLQSLQVQWSVNYIAQLIGIEVLKDTVYGDKTKRWLLEERTWLTNALTGIGLNVYPSDTNFLLCSFPKESGLDVKIMQKRLGLQGVLIRDASLFKGLDASYCRVAVRLRADNERLVIELKQAGLRSKGTALERVELSSEQDPAFQATAEVGYSMKAQKKLAPTLMVQGTSSDVGKSIITTALCRILLQDGRRVAPFKSQNMSLNSYVTPDGKEIGRAQGMQADACRTAATTDMNPILLKPKGDMTSQLIVHGKPYRDLDFRSYRESYAEEAESIVKAALLRLRRQYDVIVIEGAGSPAEINLKDRDIVNMRLAGWADAPVILVADIDRGGVFASLVGTLEILSPEEKARVRGFIINKFRGDVSLLKPGLDWLEKRTGKPVLGVIPYLADIQLEDEDSASLDAKIKQQNKPDSQGEKVNLSMDKLDIAVIRLPRISNFTDFDPLLEEEDVTLRYVMKPEEWGHPDVVILPGSKNTVEDLLFLRAGGLEGALLNYVQAGGRLTGICAGYQMMGERLLDPLLVESNKSEVAGLALLPSETTFAADKKTERVQGFTLIKGIKHLDDAESIAVNTQEFSIEGYEIHMGQTRFTAEVTQPFQIRLERHGTGSHNTFHPDGIISTDGKLWGTYIHGIWHNDDFRRYWLNQIRIAKGWPVIAGNLQFQHRREAAFERLAAHVRGHLDMTKIYEMIQI